MSHSVIYLINIIGKQFNSALPSKVKATESKLGELRENDAYLEFLVPGTKCEVMAEVTGDITILWTSIKYSWLQGNDTDTRVNVQKVEDFLISQFSEVKKLRLDEYLVEEWESQTNEYWFRDGQNFSLIEQWLKSKPIESWSIIQ